MQVTIDQELISICQEILGRSLTDHQWAEIESSDMFQTENYCGGYDADEKEFCFSYYENSNQELWFQFGLTLAQEIAEGTIKFIAARTAE